MKFFVICEALIPYYGSGARFRFYLRVREFFRIHKMYFLAQCLKSLLQYKYGCEISINAKISPQSLFMHTVGVVIGEGCIVEKGVTIYSNVVLGRKDIYNEDDYPTIKSGVILSTGTKVLGKVVVGSNTTIGACSLVITDCESNSVYVGIPAR